MLYSVQYHFFQRFAVPTRKAYNWCVSFDPADHELMGCPDAKRQITQVAENTIILTDIFHIKGEWIEKQKLVQLYPDRFRWIATHLNGPMTYSQFTYEISAEGESGSRLAFTGLFIDYDGQEFGKVSAEALAERLRKEDSDVWILLAKAMMKDLGALDKK